VQLQVYFVEINKLQFKKNTGRSYTVEIVIKPKKIQEVSFIFAKFQN
jgi:hypothetical protein